MRLKGYENASIYKERIKRWYDKRLKEFKEGDKVLLVVWTSLGPLPRWVLGPTTRWAPETTRLVPHDT
jgi:hypothetical protein